MAISASAILLYNNYYSTTQTIPGLQLQVAQIFYQSSSILGGKLLALK